jgi:hypothetical protein
MAITQAQLNRWGADPAAFAEEVLWAVRPDTEQPGPVKLEPHQREWLQAAAERGADGHFRRRVCIASWPKREGKTWLAAILAVWRAVTMRRQRIGVLANSERQAQSNLFAECANFLRFSPMLKGLVPESDFQTRVLRVPALGNKIECYPANWRTIQGTAFDLLLTDELHAAEDRGRAFTYASQQTEGRDAQVVIASQAGENVAANPLWRHYQEWKRNPEGHILFDYRQDPLTPWAIRLAARAQLELLPAEYDRLWRNCWGALGQKLFRVDDIEAAARDYEPPRSAEEWRVLQKALGIEGRPVTLGVGLDRAGVSREGDRTVWTVVAEFEGRCVGGASAPIVEVGEATVGAEAPPTTAGGDPGPPLLVVCDCLTLETGSEAEVLAADRWTRDIYGPPDRVVMEAYGCSDLVGKVRDAVIDHPTPQTQQLIFNRLYRAFRERRVWYPAHVGREPKSGTTGLLKAELLNLEYEMGTNMLRFGTQSGHDDHPYSLAWAAHAAGQGLRLPVFVQEIGAGQERPRTQAEINAAMLEGRAEMLWGEEDE